MRADKREPAGSPGRSIVPSRSTSTPATWPAPASSAATAASIAGAASIPTAGNTRQVAQAIAPESRVVYVDNDPIVLVLARALLTSAEPGTTSYIEADLRNPGKILQQASRLLDFTQPVAVMLVAVLHLISDDDNPRQIVNTLMDAVPAGSYLAVSHHANEL